MTNRIKPKYFPFIKSLDEIDGVLFQTASLETVVKQEEAEAENAINRIKENTAKRLREPLEMIEVYEKGMNEYADAHPELFEKRKTIKLLFGSFGFHKSTKLLVSKESLKLIIKKKLRHLLEPQPPKIIKKALGSLSDEELDELEIVKDKKNTFWYKIDEENFKEKMVHKEGA